MGLLRTLKAKYYHKIAEKYVKTIKRRQLNFNCDERVILGVKFLAVILEVPVYVIGEHVLQVGCYHVLTAIADKDNRQKIIEHLVKTHLLGDELNDDENILKVGEKG